MTGNTPAADLERAVRSALRRRLQLSRIEEHERWDDECAQAILRAAEAANPSFTLIVKLADDGTVTVGPWTFPEAGTGLELPAREWAAFVAAVKAGAYDETVTVPARAAEGAGGGRAAPVAHGASPEAPQAAPATSGPDEDAGQPRAQRPARQQPRRTTKAGRA